MATLEEQETVIVVPRRGDLAYVYTSDTTKLHRYRRDDRFTEVDGDEEQGNFTIPLDRVNPLRIVKSTRVLTEEQKAAGAERLRRAREAKA